MSTHDNTTNRIMEILRFNLKFEGENERVLNDANLRRIVAMAIEVDRKILERDGMKIVPSYETWPALMAASGGDENAEHKAWLVNLMGGIAQDAVMGKRGNDIEHARQMRRLRDEGEHT